MPNLTLFVDPESGWLYGFPRAWDLDKPFNESSRQEKVAWLISKGYPEQLAKKTSLRYWTEGNI